MNTLVVKDVCCGEDDTDIFFNDSSDSGSNDNTSIDLDCEGDDEARKRFCYTLHS